MLIIKRTPLIAVFVLACIALVLLGLYGYFTIGGLKFASGIELKYYSERFVFISAIFVIALALLFAMIYVQSRLLIREMRKISDVIRYGDEHISVHLRKLGPLGNEIDALFFELNKLNEAKSLRIGTLSQINGFLLENIDAKIVVAHASGLIEDVSKRFLEESSLQKERLVNSDLGEVIAGLDTAELMRELELTRKPSVRNGYSFHPVFDPLGRLSSLICLAGRETKVEEFTKKAEKIGAEQVKTIKRVVNRIFKKTPSLQK